MSHSIRRLLLTSLAAVFYAPIALHAQKDRIVHPVDRLQTIALRGNVHPNAAPRFDAGPVDPALQLRSIALALKPSPGQQAELELLLTDQQDPLSPSYHKWLTPEQYADRFGTSQADISKIAAWLESEGLSVDLVARGRNWIWFSGDAARLQIALHTELRRYSVDGEMHFANASAPSLPRAIAPLVTAILGLDDFLPTPAAHGVAPPRTGAADEHYMAPDDFATIYNVAPLYNAGYDGSGQSIVIAGASDVDLSMIRNFRSQYGLPSDPQLLTKILAPTSRDPGMQNNQFVDEANLDLMWAGAVARRSKLIFVYSTNVLGTSVAYAINQNLAPIISFSYGLCERRSAPSSLPALRQLAQQAASQGITWVASSGDSGAAGCDPHDSRDNTQARNGLSVAVPASIPEVTAVGGTQFNEGGGMYWRNTLSATYASALSYIPEIGWNESGIAGLRSSGGGFSDVFSKPPWQTGPGVPDRNSRAVPDIALTAAGHDGYLGLRNADGSFSYGTGTSAAAPAFAGILALVEQYTHQAGQGNINPNLYRLAQSTAGVFHDITGGNNIVPCAAGSQDCSNGYFGYIAGPGYDLVTGLGSVNAYNLATHWTERAVNSTTSLTVNPSSFPLNGSTQATAVVQAIGSRTVPTGGVSFLAISTSSGKSISLGSAALDSSGAATLRVDGSQFLTAGNFKLTAGYGGSGTINGSSGTVSITVNPPVISNSAIIPSVTPDPVYQQQADAGGYSWFFTLTLTEAAGVATRLTGLSIDGSDYTSQIVDFFGTASVPAYGTIQANLRSRGLAPPVLRVFAYNGVDDSGRQWSQQISVPFYGSQITAAMALSSAPSEVRQNPGNNSDCQWRQSLGVQELNGRSVQLTQFLAGGNDFSDQIQDFFGSGTLPAFGSLVSDICWSSVSPIPGYLEYQLDGVDEGGNNVTVTLSTLFEGPAARAGSLRLSQAPAQMNVSPSSPTATASIGIDLTPGYQWRVSVFPSNQTTRWLGAYPLSGSGTGTVNLAGSGAGLDPGTYTATLVLQAIDANPQFINLPVTMVVAPPPAISTLSPASAVKGSGAFTLGVSGSGFVPGTVAAWNGTPLPTTYVNSGELLALVDRNATIADGAAVITAVGLGQASRPKTFPINPSYGATFRQQVVTNVAPDPSGCVRPPSKSAFTSADGMIYLYFEATVTAHDSITGEWLGPDGSVVSEVSWSPDAGTYCFTGGSLSIPSSRGPWEARVYDNGDLLFAIPFSVGGPGIWSLSPTSAAAGATALQLMVGGAGFDSHGAVKWTRDGRTSSLPAQFQSPVLLQATIPATLLTSPGTAQIAVTTSTGAISNAVTFYISGGPVSQSVSNAASADRGPSKLHGVMGRASRLRHDPLRRKAAPEDTAKWSGAR